MKTLTADQLDVFLREAKNSGVFEMYYLELATGLRRGELLGLKWEDIDLDEGILRVRRQVCRISGTVTEAPLKTKNAYRTLLIGEDAVAVLKQQKEKGVGNYVFPSLTGGPISPDSVQKMLHRVLARAGLPPIRFHDLRHTFATRCVEVGFELKSLSEVLGHANTSITLDRYAHSSLDLKRENMNKLTMLPSF